MVLEELRMERAWTADARRTSRHLVKKQHENREISCRITDLIPTQTSTASSCEKSVQYRRGGNVVRPVTRGKEPAAAPKLFRS